MSMEHIQYGFGIVNQEEFPPLVKQVHGSELVEVTDVRQKDELLASPLSADGVLTKSSDFELYVFTADCIPLLFFRKRYK